MTVSIGISSLTAIGNLLYTLTELSLVITVHRLFEDGSLPQLLQRFQLRPYGDSTMSRIGEGTVTAAATVRLDQSLVCTVRNSKESGQDTIVILDIRDSGYLEDSVRYITPGTSHMRAAGCSEDHSYVAIGGRDGGGLIVFDREWKRLAQLDLPSIARILWL
jgi:hypothetical protein